MRTEQEHTRYTTSTNRQERHKRRHTAIGRNISTMAGQTKMRRHCKPLNRQSISRWTDGHTIVAPNWYRFTSHYSEEEDNLKGTRLLKYLVNNYWNDLYLPKTIWGHNYKTKRKSRVFVSDDSVLTGYCMDYEILKPIYDFLKSPDDNTLYELMDRCLDGFFKACRDDMEYQLSEEAFAESCEANNYEFLSNGTLFN